MVAFRSEPAGGGAGGREGLTSAWLCGPLGALLPGVQPLGAVAVVVVDLDAVLLHQLHELRLQRGDLRRHGNRSLLIRRLQQPPESKEAPHGEEHKRLNRRSIPNKSFTICHTLKAIHLNLYYT